MKKLLNFAAVIAKVSLLALLLAAAGCGNKGDLYLPDPAEQTNP